ncbi:MAG: MFS transporter [Janthinobacterium lividum]
MSSRLDGATVLDVLPISAAQIQAVLLIAATVILDGLDNQMLGLAASSLIKEWGVSRAQLGSVFALGFVGMAVGTLIAGWIGDHSGRRLALLVGVGLFGLATLLMGFATTIVEVAVLKTLAGVGLGGVPGTAAAMISEFVPARWRTTAVTFGVVSVSIGGILGGVAASLILPGLGWRWLFYIGGAATFAFTAALIVLLPESPGFLAAQPGRAAELAAMLRRMGHAPILDAPATMVAAAVPMRDLFSRSLRRDTAALSVAMFAGMFMIYLMFNWAPTLLTSTGFDLASASLGLTSFNLGGTIGALATSVVIIRLGSRAPLVILAIVGAGVCVMLAVVPIGGRNATAMLIGLAALGLSASAAQSAMFAVGTHVFPTVLRARGLGLMGAAGRIGAIVSAFSGAWLIGQGSAGFFGALGALMLLNAAGFAAIRRHIPRFVARYEGSGDGRL